MKNFELIRCNVCAKRKKPYRMFDEFQQKKLKLFEV
jgi:hypothetical protein